MTLTVAMISTIAITDGTARWLVIGTIATVIFIVVVVVVVFAAIAGVDAGHVIACDSSGNASVRQLVCEHALKFNCCCGSCSSRTL